MAHTKNQAQDGSPLEHFRIRDLVAPDGLFEISATSLRKLVRDKVFPQPTKVNRKTVWWPRSAVFAAIPAVEAAGFRQAPIDTAAFKAGRILASLPAPSLADKVARVEQLLAATTAATQILARAVSEAQS